MIGSVKANDYGASSFLASGNAVMQRDPTFAFVTIGTGCYLGFTVRDLILANSLHRRGFKVVIYWMMECNSAIVDKGIRQRILCRGIRYHFKRPSDFLDKVVGPLLFLFPGNVRVRVIQNASGLELDERAGKIGHGGRSDDDVRYSFYADQLGMSPQFVGGPCGISLCVRIQSVRSGVKDAYVTSAFVRIVPAILRAGQRDRSVPTINGVGASG